MRITSILAIFFVLAGSIAFTYDDAEAARRNKRVCICTGPNGTLRQGCPVHGNGCIGQQTHEHDSTRGRRTDLPIVCTINGHTSLWYAPSCRAVKDQVRQQERAVRESRRIAKARQRQEERQQRKYMREMNDLPIISDFQREIRKENKRIYNDFRNDVRHDVRDTVRGWYGR